MAKLEKITDRDFDGLLHSIEEGILEVSISASLEDSSDFQSGNEPVHLSAITAGGSQAMFFKINEFGEEAFLGKLREIL